MHDSKEISICPVPKPKGRPRKGQEKVNKSEAVKLYLQNGLSMGEIARHFGCGISHIHRVLHEFLDLLPDPERLKAFQASKAEFMDAALLESWSSYMKACKSQKGTANQFAFGASKWNEMARLENGKSTQNVGVMTKMVEDSRSDFKRLCQEEQKTVNDTTKQVKRRG